MDNRFEENENFYDSDASSVSQQSESDNSESDISEDIGNVFEIFCELSKDKHETSVEPTNRIKICHYDFKFLNADSLIVILNPELQKNSGGTIVSMIKYPTQLGMERSQEDVPKEYDINQSDNEYSGDEGEETLANLKYFKATLKFYEIELVFDNVECAKNVMNSLDGIEIENTKRLLDLRYLKDDEVYIIPEDYQYMVEDLTFRLKHPPKRLQLIADLPDSALNDIYEGNFNKLNEDDWDSDNNNDLCIMSDNDISNSEMSGTDGEDNSLYGVMKFKRSRKRVRPEDARKFLGFDDLEASEDEASVEEEIEDLNDTEGKSAEEDVEESVSSDGEDDNSEIDDDESKNNKISNRDRMKIAIKEKHDKNNQRINAIINFYLEKVSDQSIVQQFIRMKSHIHMGQEECIYHKHIETVQKLFDSQVHDNDQGIDGDNEDDTEEVLKSSQKKKRKASSTSNNSVKRMKLAN